jgi:hypothetical protein
MSAGKGTGGPASMADADLRDYFAAKALPAVVEACKADDKDGLSFSAYFAKQAYLIADAMLSERAK